MLVVTVVLFAFGSILVAGLSREHVPQLDIGSLSLVVLASGVIACAAIESIRRVFPVRGAFQHAAVTAWLERLMRDGRARKTDETGKAEAKHYLPKRATEQLYEALGFIEPAAPGWHRWPFFGTLERWSRDFEHRSAVSELFDAPIEQLTAQLAQAAERALANAQSFPDLAAALVGDAADQQRRGSTVRRDTGVAVDIDLVQQRLDLLQIVTARRWRKALTVSSLLIAGFVGWIIAVFVSPGATVLVAGIALVGGGFVSWVVRDLSAGIARWRDR
ncbi:hypothetical protein [Microbacterium sp. NPDC055455]